LATDAGCATGFPPKTRGNDVAKYTGLIVLEETIKPVVVEDFALSPAELPMIAVESNPQPNFRHL